MTTAYNYLDPILMIMFRLQLHVENICQQCLDNGIHSWGLETDEQRKEAS